MGARRKANSVGNSGGGSLRLWHGNISSYMGRGQIVEHPCLACMSDDRLRSCFLYSGRVDRYSLEMEGCRATALGKAVWADVWCNMPCETRPVDLSQL